MKIIATDRAPAAIGAYSQATVHQGVVYASGQIALLPDGTWAGAIRDEDVATLPIAQVEWLKGAAGTVTVHNCCAVHGSMPNHSPRVRRLLLQTYSHCDAFPIKHAGANGNLGRYGGLLIGGHNAQSLTISGRSFRCAPDWSAGKVPTIFGSQQKE